MLKAVALAQEAQLKMLRYQLNPHFLFNTLNAISTLILDNQNKKANQAVTRLSEFLRYTLDQDPMKKVTLRQELEALDLYLGTERLRFGERLRLEYAIEESAMNALVPSLLLQPLLENSLKYAVSAREQGGLVRIEGRTREGWLELAVIDDGPGLREGTPVSERRGVGLRNTSERLAVLYGDNHRFSVGNSNPGLRVDMALPLELAEPGHEAARQARRLRHSSWRGAHTHEDPHHHRRRRGALAPRRRAASARRRRSSRSSRSAPTAVRRWPPSSSTSRTCCFSTSRCRACRASRCWRTCRRSHCRWWCSSPPTTSTPSRPSRRARSTTCSSPSTTRALRPPSSACANTCGHAPPPTSATASCRSSPRSPAAVSLRSMSCSNTGARRIENRHPEVLPIRQGRETVRVPVAVDPLDRRRRRLHVHPRRR